MKYSVVTVRIESDGSVTLGKRAQTILWPGSLRVGGIYFLRPGKPYKVLGRADA